MSNRCPNSKLNIEICDTENETHRTIPARCKRWICEVCASINSRNLGRLIHAAFGSWIDESRLNNAQLKYRMKMISLTVPGSVWRSVNGIDAALEQGTKSLKALLRGLRKDFKVEEYVWVLEEQSSGYPHWHLIVLGDGVVTKELMGYVNRFWDERFGEPARSSVELVRSAKGSCFYLTKYLSKGSQKTRLEYEGYHRYGMSRALRSRVKEQKELGSERYEVIKVFRRNEDGSNGSLIWEKGCGYDLGDAFESAGLGDSLQECLSFFKLKALQGEQKYFFQDD